MAQRKTVTLQTLIGEAGIALIGQRVSDMGFLWHPRRVDHGIDGHIDLIDPTTRAVLNSQLLVQSKAQDRPFASETEQGFHYLCDPRDLDLWLGGNAPVILVLSHPKTGQAWWIDISAAFPDARSRASRRVDVDKVRDRFDASAGPALLDRGQDPRTGLYLPPTPMRETLTSNLLTITDLPPVVHLAPAVTGSYSEAGRLLRTGRDRINDAWLLTDGAVMSFADLTAPAWDRLRTGDVERFDTAEWAHSTDTIKINQISSLISRTVQNSYPQLRWHREERHVHFAATRDLSPFKVGYGAGKRARAAFVHHPGKDGGPGYYAHAAANLRPRRIGQDWYLQITPDWCYSSDGRTPHPFAEILRSGIKRLERQSSVRGAVKMWVRFLSQEQDLFSTHRLIGLGQLLTLDVEHGIIDHLWTDTTDPDPQDTIGNPQDGPADAVVGGIGVGVGVAAAGGRGDDPAAGDHAQPANPLLDDGPEWLWDEDEEL